MGEPKMSPEEIKSEVAQLALPILVERLAGPGGTVIITEQQYAEFGERHGGLRNVGVKLDWSGGQLYLSLIEKTDRPPLN